MAMPEHIAAQVAQLDPASRAVVQIIWHMYEQLLERLASLEAQNEKYRQMLFGARSEKLPPIDSEVRRAVEADELTPAALGLADDATDAEIAAAQTTERRKRGRKASGDKRKERKADLLKLPVVRERVLVRDDELPEGMTRDDFEVVGEGVVVQRIEHVREHLVMTEYVLETLASRQGDVIVKASAPPSVVDGGLWAASAYAKVIVDKCVDSLPFYRQERALGRAGHAVARSVLCSLFHRAAELLAPVYQRLVEVACEHPYVHADETTLRIGEPGNARTGWVWTVVCEDVVAYVFSESRASETPNHLLAGSKGVLIADGYAGYNGVVGDDGRLRAGCWAHARRRFFDALKTEPRARQMLDMIVQLYRIERDAADRELLGTDVHLEMRNELSRPVVEAIETWVDEHRGVTHPQSPFSGAVEFAYGQRAPLRQFLDDPKIPLDNNIAERALRVVAVGRKNYLFVGHAEGGHNLAVLQTLCHTCLLHDVNPYEYIRDVLIRVSSHPASRLDELLPQRWAPPP
jgi:transposase